MKSKKVVEKEDHPPKCFLAGAKWPRECFADEQDFEECFLLIKNFDIKKKLSNDEAFLIETTLNSLALNILIYSASEWGNDYYGCVNSFREIANFIDKHSKKHNYGRHFDMKRL